MKILDRYILKSFLITFATVFVILFFIFVLQGIWLFISELAGKDLNFLLIVKFLSFYSPTIVPLVLPLSVLLASIMTFGSFAENYEFAAMKASGISLKRALQGLTVFIVILSGVAFIFANDVIPKAQFKFINLRKNIVQQKPSMVIAEGQFSTIGNYNIKVAKKHGDDGNLLDDVTIHKISNMGMGTTLVIKAKNGELIGSEDSNFLQLVLFDGNYYEDIISKNFEERKKNPFAKSNFKRYVINFDLAPLNKSSDDEQITNTNNMLNVSELRYTIDSLENNQKKDIVAYTENIQLTTPIVNLIRPHDSKSITKSSTEAVTDILSLFDSTKKTAILQTAINNVSNAEYVIENNKNDLLYKQKNINSHWLALYDKFVIAFGCLLMFFIGAPLGAIIRKGGLGLPIVFAVLIFITFHFINVFGKKLAQENVISPFMGAWISTFTLAPLAILLTYRATNDIGLFNIDNVIQPITNFFTRVFTKTPKN